jgi:hypothetical protein
VKEKEKDGDEEMEEAPPPLQQQQMQEQIRALAVFIISSMSAMKHTPNPSIPGTMIS